MDVSVNIDDLPEYKTGMQFAEKTKVKVMGLDGVWYSGTVTPVKTGGCIVSVKKFTYRNKIKWMLK